MSSSAGPSTAGPVDRLRVVLLIRSLNRGGAERQLALLATGLDPREFQVTVMTFYRGGPIWDELAAVPQIELLSLDKKGRWDNVGTVRRLEARLGERMPAILHCYMPEPSIAGTLAGRRAGVRTIVWGVRSSNVDYAKYGWFNRASFRTAAWLSRRPDLIIANSEAGRAFHVAHGYPADRIVTIPNGIDTARFQPSAASRLETRRRWSLAEDEIAIGVVARLDLMKGHEVLLEAAASVVRTAPAVRIICVGAGEAGYTRHLADATRRLNLQRHVVWTGEVDRPESIYPAFDFACSASVFGEGFSNAVAEAMACERPCVVTDVGDSASIVADKGIAVPPSNPARLAEGLLTLAQLSAAERHALGARARARIVQEFSLHAMIQRTAVTYRDLSERRPRPESPTGATT